LTRRGNDSAARIDGGSHRRLTYNSVPTLRAREETYHASSARPTHGIGHALCRSRVWTDRLCHDLGALTLDDAAYPSAFVEGDGPMPDTAYKYVPHFEKDWVPPSHSGVWSISPYRENFYVRNAIGRYGILSSMPLQLNTDGSLDIYVQATSPGVDKEANWLPI